MIALLSLGTTLGLRHADAALAELLADAGADVEVVAVRVGMLGKLRRQITVIDLVEGLAARRAARATRAADALIVSSATTSLLLEDPRRPHAIRYDSPTALNRPGPAGAWQRARERRAFARADVLLPWGEAAAAATPPHPCIVPLPVPIATVPPAATRTDEVLTYAGWMDKRGIDLLAAAWAQVAPARTRLVIGGATAAEGRRFLARRGVPEPAGIEWAGRVPHAQWLARVAAGRLYVNASRREDHGLGPLEALAAGTPLVTLPAAGAYEALPIARRLAPDLVAGGTTVRDLATALRAGLAHDDPGYASAAAAALAPYERARVLATVRDRVVPLLLGSST